MEKKSHQDIEEELMAHLSSTNLSKAHLSSISKSIASSQGAGLKIVDWWIYGIPAFERIVIQGHLPMSGSSVFQKLIANEQFKEIAIFRKGIPKPDFFQVNLTIDKISQNAGR
ncbi:MAG: hypothetical protein ABIO82_00520 [Ginsengibacter sp.]